MPVGDWTIFGGNARNLVGHKKFMVPLPGNEMKVKFKDQYSYQIHAQKTKSRTPATIH